MSTIQPQSLRSPGAEEVFSTPPTTPAPQVQTEQVNQTLSRRNSRPTSLHIDHLQSAEWNPGIILDTSSPIVHTNGPHHPSTTSPMDNSEPGLPEYSPSANHQRSRSHMNSQPIDSPCFVHSHLDKGASLTDWLRNRSGANQTIVGDLGVARSLQHTTAPGGMHNLNGYSPFAGSKHNRPTNGESDGEEDEFVGSLTKQLAETAVGVREMSKQLGNKYVLSLPIYLSQYLFEVALVCNPTSKTSSSSQRPVTTDSSNSLANLPYT